MDKQSETTDPRPKRRGFFDRPASMDFWMSVGGRFWGGFLSGLGWGMFLGSTLIKDELIPLNSMFWFISWMVLFFIGLNIALRAVNRSDAPGTDRSQKQ